MIIEVCDFCGSSVNEDNKTEVIVKDHKGLHIYGYGEACRAKRRYKAVICDECLRAISEKRFKTKNENA